jgi:hypothetical protein
MKAIEKDVFTMNYPLTSFDVKHHLGVVRKHLLQIFKKLSVKNMWTEQGWSWEWKQLYRKEIIRVNTINYIALLEL